MIFNTLDIFKTLKGGCQKLSIILALVVAVVSCTPSLERFDSLANQGILPLSNDNPHLGANLFLAQEAQRSNYLLNFLKKRGGPSAIEILTEGRSRPTMILFYPLKKEVYACDLDSTPERYQWILRGPYMMERQDFRDLNGMGVSFAAEPVFMIFGQSTRFGARPIETEKRVLLPVIPTPKPAPIRKKSPNPATYTAQATPTPFRPLNSDQQAIALSQGFAERADNGDLIHVVTTEGESANDIAQWYTGAPANAKAILEKNGLAKDAPLAVGTKIQIPFALVKQFQAYKGKGK